MRYKNIIFDLDGTLIDSADSILASIAQALANLSIQPLSVLDRSIIGPPLTETLELLTGIEQKDRLAALVAAFKQSYDEESFRKTEPFDGISEFFQRLQDHGCQLYIVTNKRNIPTQKIIDMLGWRQFFSAIYCIDSALVPYVDKAEAIRQCLSEQSLSCNASVYIGDRDEDGLAAEANGLPFLQACWGYNADFSKPWIRFGRWEGMCSHLESL